MKRGIVEPRRVSRGLRFSLRLGDHIQFSLDDDEPDIYWMQVFPEIDQGLAHSAGVDDARKLVETGLSGKGARGCAEPRIELLQGVVQPSAEASPILQFS